MNPPISADRFVGLVVAGPRMDIRIVTVAPLTAEERSIAAPTVFVVADFEESTFYKRG